MGNIFNDSRSFLNKLKMGLKIKMSAVFYVQFSLNYLYSIIFLNFKFDDKKIL